MKTTEEKFRDEFASAVMPILVRYSTYPDVPIEFIAGAIGGFVAGLCKGAGLDRSTTMTMITAGASAAWDRAENEEMGKKPS